MRRIAWRGLAAFLAFVVLMGMAGIVFAWQYSQPYVWSTLYNMPNGQPWSPYQGTLSGDVAPSGSLRQTNPIGSNVAWYPVALDYIRTHGQNVAITFHSFDINNGCSSFKIGSSAGTNLPAPQYLYYNRQCAFQPTEGRIYSTNAWLISPNTPYWGQALYTEMFGTSTTQKITVDTYYGSSPNWHQTYCIAPYVTVASIC